MQARRAPTETQPPRGAPVGAAAVVIRSVGALYKLRRDTLLTIIIFLLLCFGLGVLMRKLGLVGCFKYGCAVIIGMVLMTVLMLLV
jgi:hypothetical protein